MTFFYRPNFLICFLLFILFDTANTHGQDKEVYQVFKLEQKIGTEVISTLTRNDSTFINIASQLQDRGYPIQLKIDLRITNDKINLISKGQTSRFKEEQLDTEVNLINGFPISDNGSIKIRELLIAYWIKMGKPKSIKSAISGSDITIQEMINPFKDDAKLSELQAYMINHDLDEVLWLNKKGKSVFFATIDSENDKRELISEDFIAEFEKLNQESSRYLIQSYISKSKVLAEKQSTIAILAGTIVDIAQNGELRENNMVLIKDGRISYVGITDKSLIPTGAKVIDATNKFLIPGLWDMHAHIFHPSFLEKQLLSGVTSVRDMANEFDLVVKLKELTKDKSVPTPDLYAAGLLDGKSPRALGRILATNADEIKTNILRYHNAGFDQIKIYDNIKKKDFNTIVDLAKQYKMDVVGHLPTGYTINYFINNGMKSVSHIHFFMNSINWKTNDLITANRPLLDSLKSHHVYLDPTLNIYQLIKDSRLGSFRKLVKLFSDYGISIVAGTDNEGTISDEIQNYIQSGMSPLDAIKSATIIPAVMMGASDVSGSIEKGKNGDLLILDENPLLNISTLKKIHTVIKGSFIIHP